MTDAETTYVLDANVFVQAHRRWYGFPFHPGFWSFLLRMRAAGRVVSIDRVREEILGGDILEEWLRENAPQDFFQTTAQPGVVAHFAKMMQWVNANPQFRPEAKVEFARVADGWLAAYAKAHPLHVLVTHEEFSADARKRVPLPNVCRQFEIPCIDTFEMLRRLNASFVEAPKPSP